MIPKREAGLRKKSCSNKKSGRQHAQLISQRQDTFYGKDTAMRPGRDGQTAATLRDKKDSVDALLAEWRRERPDLDPSPVAILGRLHRISARLQRRVEAWLDPLDLTWESFSLILTLRRSGAPFALRPTDLYRESLLTSGAITNRIDRVEKKGLVRRRQDPNDGRVMVVQLTAAGRRLADKAVAIHFRALAETFSSLSRQECAQLNTSLARLMAVLETE
jgi:DNA-binding MarR family transcriptional regulator